MAAACGAAHSIEDEGDAPRAREDGGAGDRDEGGDGSGTQPSARDDAGGAAGSGQDPGGSAGGASPDVPAGPAEPTFVADPESPVFDQSVLRNYAVTVDPDEWAHINETAYLEQYIQGSVVIDGQTYAPIGLRFKGFRGSLYSCFDFDQNGNSLGRTCDRLPLKLSFDEYDENGRYQGLKKLNFHAMRLDASMLRERLTSWIFRQFGVPAPRVVHATLSVNGQSLGVFALVEEIDGRFARARFPDGGNGNVYKERWPASSADPAYFESGLESNRMDPSLDVSPMVRFAEDLMGATDETIEDVLREHTELDALMRYLAVDRAVESWDAITAFRCQPEADVPPLPPEVYAAQTPPLGWEVCQNKNYYWYESDDDDREWLIAWDMDMTFGSFSQFPDWNTEPTSCVIEQQGRPPRCDALIDWFATTLRPRYVQAGNALLAGPLQATLIRAQLEQWYAQIVPIVGADSLDLGVQSLLDQIDAHIADFRRDLAR